MGRLLDLAITFLVAAGGIAGIEFLRKFAGLLAEDAHEFVRDSLRRS